MLAKRVIVSAIRTVHGHRKLAASNAMSGNAINKWFSCIRVARMKNPKPVAAAATYNARGSFERQRRTRVVAKNAPNRTSDSVFHEMPSGWAFTFVQGKPRPTIHHKLCASTLI